MALSDRAAAAALYAQKLLSDRDVQDALRRAFGATRDAYARGRGSSAGQAVKDKKLRRQLEQALTAVCELWSVLCAYPRRKSRARGKLAAVALVSAAGFLVLNVDARERMLILAGMSDAMPTEAPQ